MRRIFLGIVAGLVLFFGCKKRGVVKEEHISPELLAGFSYKVGSYWIYRDSVTGEIDSMYVTGNETSQATSSSKDLTLITDLNGVNFVQKSAGGLHANDSIIWGMSLTLKNIAFVCFFRKSTFTYSKFLAYPYQEGYYTPGDTIDLAVLPSFNVNGFTYANVACMHRWLKIDTIEPDFRYIIFTHNDVFYINNTDGIIKMRLDHPADTLFHVWELVRRNVVK